MKGLYFCGIRKGIGTQSCYFSLNQCAYFNIWGTCRPQRKSVGIDPVWCLYESRYLLWGCYASRHRCEEKTLNHRSLLDCLPLKPSL